MANTNLIELADGSKVTPTLHQVLQRPMTGQGGFQSLMRAVQEYTGVEPVANWISPFAVRGTQRIVPQVAATVAVPKATSPAVVATPKAAKADATGITAERLNAALVLCGGDALRAMALVMGMHGIETTGEAAEAAPVVEAPAPAPKARKAKLNAPRKRIKAKRVYNGLRRTYDDGRTVAAKMREKFGDNWRDLVSE